MTLFAVPFHIRGVICIPGNKGFPVSSVAYVFYAEDCSHIPKTTHNFNNERTIIMKIYFSTNAKINITFTDNMLLFLSCAEIEKNLHTIPNSQRLIDNLTIDESLKYATQALGGELHSWTDAMDKDWSP